MHITTPRKRKVWISVACMVLVIGLLPRCMSLRMSDKQIEAYFKDTADKPSFYKYTLRGRNMHYASIGADSLPMVLFIHGSPGSWDAFISFFKDSLLIRSARVVSVDRPGFGKSDLGEPEFSLREQVALIMPILKTNKSGKLPVLVGHSMGGPVAVRLAMDYPELVGGVVLVAPSIDPDLEKWQWYRYLGDVRIIRLILPVELDVSNQEIMPLKQELRKLLPLWANIQVPVTVIQGEADKLVPPGNADFASKMLIHAPVDIQRIPGLNQFIPWSRPDLIQKAILKQLGH